MTFCRCHCRDCGSHFSSLEAFDAHHEGSGSTLVPCVFPESAPLVAITGTCKIDDPDRPHLDAVVYTTERAQEASEVLPGPPRARERAGRALRGGSGVNARRPEQPDRPVQDRTPKNILLRPLKSHMRNIKDQGTEVGACVCRQPVCFYHSNGEITCICCHGRVEEIEE